jgi:asparagine synthetase B (glutamine-hydrolysing)
MIFDFLCERRSHSQPFSWEDEPLLERASRMLPIYRTITAFEYTRNYDNFRVRVLARDVEENVLFENDLFLLVVVGDVFLRFDSTWPRASEGALPATVLGEMYMKFQHGIVEHIKGTFKLIVYDKKNDELSAINCFNGMATLLYGQYQETFFLTSALYFLPHNVRKNLQVRKASVLEFALFNYPLGNNTFFESVFNLEAGAILSKSKDAEPSISCYKSIEDLFSRKSTKPNEDLDNGIRIFQRVVKSYIADRDKVCMSLTGGFDGRAVFASSQISPERVLLYAFGIKNSKNLNIPTKIAKALGYRFDPILLDEEYEKVFPEYGRDLCLLSDLELGFRRANYLFAFDKLRHFSDVVLTGIVGSEIMRPFQNAGDNFSINMVKIILSDDPKQTFREIAESFPGKQFWNAEIFSDKVIEESISYFAHRYLKSTYATKNEFFYSYFLNDSLRKYSGGEIQAERIFASNRYPFYDDEFFELFIISSYSALRKNFLSPTPSERYNSQLFYVHLLKKWNPKLLYFKTDHGFAPLWLLLPFPILTIGIQFIFKKLYNKITGYKEFNTEQYAQQMVSQYSWVFNDSEVTDKPEVDKLLQSGSWRHIIDHFRGILSVNLYLAFLKNK